MSQIDYEKVKVIVENNLRNSGLNGGVLENGWKDTITVDNKDYPQPFGLQSLRNVIAQSIVDALTDAVVTGSPTTGSSGPGSGNVVTNTSIINITTGTLSDSKDAVRVGDETQITSTTDPKFVAWMTAVNVFITACAACVGPATASTVGAASTIYTTAGATVGGFPPSTATGKATKGSNTVKIGD
jgi:hypothetical protein